MKVNLKKLFSSVLCAVMLTAFVPGGIVKAAKPNDTKSVPEWTAQFNGDADGGIKIDYENAYEGNGSLKIVNNTAFKSGVYVRVFTKISVKKGTEYDVSFYAKSQNSTNVYLNFGWDGHRSLLPFGSTYEWTEHALTFTAAADGNIEMMFILEGVSEGFWLDNVVVREKGTDDNMVANSTFDSDNGSQEEHQIEFDEEILGLEETYNKILTGTVFSRNEFERVRGGFKFMPVNKTSSINIDGNFDDWVNVPSMYMPTLPTQYQIYIKDDKKRDAEAEAKYAYDEDYFYLYLKSVDDIYTAFQGEEEYWRGDSFQFVISRMDEGYGIEMGVSHDEATGVTGIYSPVLQEGDIEQITAESTHEGNETIFEIRLPWILFFNERYSRPEEFLFNVLYNDNDGDGRRYCVELAPGISEGKINTEFPILHLLEGEKPWYTWLSGSKETLIGENNEYSLYIVNTDENSNEFEVDFPNGESEKVEIEGNKGIRIPFNMTFDQMNTYTVEATLTDGKYSDKAKFETTTSYVVPTINEARQFIETFEGYRDELKTLIMECEKKGISVDYPQINCSTIEKFIEYMNRDVKNNTLELFQYQRYCIEDLYKQAKGELEGYLSGETEPLSVPRYVTSEITSKNNSLWAKTQMNGKEETRPVFFVGFGHFSDVIADIPIFNDFGFNSIQAEMGAKYTIISGGGPKEWDFFIRDVDASVTVSDEEKKAGDYSLKITNNDSYTDGKYMAITQTMTVEPNTTYKFGGWAKVKNCDRLYFGVNSWNQDVNFGAGGGKTHGWKEWEYTYTTGPKETSVWVKLFSNGVTEVAYLDEMYFVKEGTDKNLLLNGGFESETEYTGFYNVTTHSARKMQKVLEDAEKNNISVCVLLSPHYFPDFVLNLYPKTKLNVAYGFLKYNIMDERIKEVIEAYLRTVIPMLKDYTSLNSICVSNEPQFFTKNMSEFYQPLWEDYLREKFGTLEKVNEAFGTDYIAIEECLIPQDEKNLAMFYEYKLFNDLIFAEWHRFMVEIIKEIAPDVPVHAKIMEYPTNVGKTRLMVQDGTKLENYVGIFDWNGNDTQRRYENIETKGPQEYILFYDYMRSIMNAPVVDTEDHPVVNGGKIFNSEVTDFVVNNTWEGAIHGRSLTDIWVWERADSERHAAEMFKSNMSYRPDAIAGIGRTALDLNRLSYEVVALQDEKADVGILYSDASAVHVRQFGTVMSAAYHGVVYAGKKVQFVTEDQPEKLNDIKALIIPYTLNVKAETVKAIYDFVANGGKVLMIDQNCLTKTEHAKEQNLELVEYIRENSHVIRDVSANNNDITSPNKDELYVIIRNFIRDIGMEYISVVDAETSEPVNDTIVDVGIYNGKLLVNIGNFANTRNVKVKVGGNVVTSSYDLLNCEELGEAFESGRFKSRLLQIETEHPFIDVFGHWSEDYVSGLFKKELVNGVSVSRFEPNGILTRAEFLTMLVRASGTEIREYKGGVVDVTSSDWFAGYVAAALEKGVVLGDVFRPNDKITREEMCGLLVAFCGKDVPSDKTANFTDMDDCSDIDAVRKAFALGFITGYEDGTFRPQNNMTRAEAAVVVTRFLGV